MNLHDMYLLVNLSHKPILVKQDGSMIYKFTQDNKWEPSTFWLMELHFEPYTDYKIISEQEAQQFMLKQINS